MRFPVVVLLACTLGSVLAARKSREPDYIGAERCRLCHRAVYQAWSRTAHKQASAGLAVGSSDRQCLNCHATGPAALQGVQCEACHGPGGNYWRPEVMLDPQKSKEAGLVDPTEAVCRSCHGRRDLPEHSPSFTMPGETEKSRFVH